MPVTATGTYASSYLASAYGRTTSAASSSGGKTTASSTTGYSAATLITLSAAAQAELAAKQKVSVDTVVADARAALDALYKAAGVTGPIVDGEQTVDLKSLDRRELYAVATNIGGTFSADEQAVAQKELEAGFDAVLAPQSAVARLTGDWSRVYQAALDYMEGAGTEEKASASYRSAVAALQKGLKVAEAQPDSVPSIAGDPVADFLARAGEDGAVDGNERPFSDVASDVRKALDLQKQAAADKGVDFTFNTRRQQAQLVDWSDFDNRSLAAIALDQGGQFSDEEVYAAKAELDQRTRTTLLAAFQQAGSTSDPRAFSLGVLYSYQSMGEEERQATHFSTELRDQAVANYRGATSLISMLQQASGGGFSYFG